VRQGDGCDRMKCCICGQEFPGHGHDPAPIPREGRACDTCNAKYVIPVRIMALIDEHRRDVDTDNLNVQTV